MATLYSSESMSSLALSSSRACILAAIRASVAYGAANPLSNNADADVLWSLIFSSLGDCLCPFDRRAIPARAMSMYNSSESVRFFCGSVYASLQAEMDVPKTVFHLLPSVGRHELAGNG